MKQATLITLFFLISIFSFSQKITAKLTGKIIGENSNPVASATVIVAGRVGGTTSNVDGYFTLSLEIGRKYEIEISAIGFVTKRINDVEVKTGQINELYITVETKDGKLNDVVVKSSSAKKESINALISYQKNANTIAQVISGEAIRRSPDKNTGEVLKRVPGLSIIDGKYLVVRGLADRYNQAMLNGVLLGTTEPDRKTFSFDIFPASIIDNIIINKAFIPEMSGEWAGGLIQVNTNDVPSSNFFDIGVGTGFNTHTVGSNFYKYKGGNTDWLGFDDGTRALPNGFPLKSSFNNLDRTQKTQYAKLFQNIWSTYKAPNNSVNLISRTYKLSTGFVKKLGKQSKLAAVLAFNYSLSPKRTSIENRIFSITNNIASTNFEYYNEKYANDVLCGGIANFTLQLGSNNKISIKNIINVNTSDYVTLRGGKDFESNSTITGDNIRASELAFKANTFFNTQISGDHNLQKYKAKIHWFGSFQMLDQYIPDQRRIQYNQDDPSDPTSPYSLLIGASNSSQRSGSRFYSSLSDYNYTTGGDISKNYVVKGLVQSVKAGYFFQVKDRLFDSRPFAIYLPSDNKDLRHLSQDVVFSPENFGNGTDNKFAFNEISDPRYRYLANSILNAGFVQSDNQLLKNKLRIVWGLRIENFDQLIGSTNAKDSRYVNIKKTDFLPGINVTYKLSNTKNIRVSGSQTVVRPEFRDLSSFTFFDFDLGATVTGNPALERTKVTNADVRYEIYPRAGELITMGVFYKYFISPTELYNNPGAGGSGTFNYLSADNASSYGAEFEFRKKLDFATVLKNFTVQGNIAYIYNRVPSLNRPMQGQSPYLINLGLQYDIEKIGLNTTLLFNQIGRRIYYVGGSDVPPVWEAPRPLLDLQIAKKVLKNKGEIKLNISDIINQAAMFYHDLNDNGKYDVSIDAVAIKRKYGSNISISFGYKIK